MIITHPEINFANTQEMSSIHNSQKAFQLLQKQFNPDCEEFWLISLKTDLTSHHFTLIAKGTLNYCAVHPRDLFREAIRSNAYAMIIAHNHPSLDVRPTTEDIQLTKKLVRLAKMLEIPILDHIIFSDSTYFSFKENKLI